MAGVSGMIACLWDAILAHPMQAGLFLGGFQMILVAFIIYLKVILVN